MRYVLIRTEPGRSPIEGDIRILLSHEDARKFAKLIMRAAWPVRVRADGKIEALMPNERSATVIDPLALLDFFPAHDPRLAPVNEEVSLANRSRENRANALIDGFLKGRS